MTGTPNGDGVKERWLFLGSGLLLTTAVLIGLAREQRWGEPMLQLRLISGNAVGLRAGQEVRISGLPVGQVRHLQLLPDARVAVQLQVERRYASLIGPKSVANQNQEGLVGDHYLEISADPQPHGRGATLNGRMIRYEPPIAVSTLMQQLLDAQRELTTTLRHTSRLTATDLPQTLREARRSLDQVGGLATALQQESTATAPELRQALRRLSRTGISAEQTSTQAQQLIRQSQPLLIRTLDDLQQITGATRRLLHSLMGLSGANDVPTNPASPAQP